MELIIIINIHGLASLFYADKALDYKLRPCRRIFRSVNCLRLFLLPARADRKDEPAFKRIAEVYHSDAVRELFDTVYKGVYIPAWE